MNQILYYRNYFVVIIYITEYNFTFKTTDYELITLQPRRRQRLRASQSVSSTQLSTDAGNAKRLSAADRR